MPPFAVLALLHVPGYLVAISYIITLISYKPSPTMSLKKFRSASPILNLALCDNGHVNSSMRSVSHK
eukprot:scaffold345560_cov29-Prasinocladus_malaysianus.AAC.1